MRALPPQRTPPAVTWYRAFCVMMAAVHGLLALGALKLALNRFDFRDLDPAFDPTPLVWIGWVIVATAAIFGLANLGLLLLPRRTWAYGLHLGNLVGAVLLCCPAPLAGPLLWFWLKPEVKAWFENE